RGSGSPPTPEAPTRPRPAPSRLISPGACSPLHPRESATLPGRMRICLVYDCLFPYTVGGAERWYRNLADRLVAAGHDVTYLTLTQWDDGVAPDLPGVEVHTVGP